MRASGFNHSDKTKAKIKASLKGKIKSKEHRSKIAASVSRARQEALARHREEALRIELAARKSITVIINGRPMQAADHPGAEASESRSPFALTDASKTKIAAALKGRSKSEEHRAKIAESVSKARQNARALQRGRDDPHHVAQKSFSVTINWLKVKDVESPYECGLSSRFSRQRKTHEHVVEAVINESKSADGCAKFVPSAARARREQRLRAQIRKSSDQ